MAIKSGESDSDLETQLLSNGRDYSFNQALRLINLLLRKNSGSTEADLQHMLRVRPLLSFEFPTSDIAEISRFNIDDKSGYQITATFLGLYGASSPLPNFYTENLFRDQFEDNPLTRDFIDIFNNHLYQLYFKIWNTHSLAYQIYEANNTNYLSYIYSLGGLDYIKHLIPEKFNMLRYVGIMGHMPRSALGLKVLLSNILEIPQIEIYQCCKKIISIPFEQRLLLGQSANLLGDNAHLGEQVASASDAFLVKIGPIDYAVYKKIVPGTNQFRLINQIIGFYINEPLTWDIEITINSQDLSGICLGNPDWSGLGRNTWLFAQTKPASTYTVLFKSNTVNEIHE